MKGIENMPSGALGRWWSDWGGIGRRQGDDGIGSRICRRSFAKKVVQNCEVAVNFGAFPGTQIFLEGAQLVHLGLGLLAYAVDIYLSGAQAVEQVVELFYGVGTCGAKNPGLDGRNQIGIAAKAAEHRGQIRIGLRQRGKLGICRSGRGGGYCRAGAEGDGGDFSAGQHDIAKIVILQQDAVGVGGEDGAIQDVAVLHDDLVGMGESG